MNLHLRTTILFPIRFQDDSSGRFRNATGQAFARRYVSGVSPTCKNP
jgi:hypothetical protein